MTTNFNPELRSRVSDDFETFSRRHDYLSLRQRFSSVPELLQATTGVAAFRDRIALEIGQVIKWRSANYERKH